MPAPFTPPDAGPGPVVASLPPELDFAPTFPKARQRLIGRMIVGGGIWSLLVAGLHGTIGVAALISAESRMGTVSLLIATHIAGTGFVCLGRGLRLLCDRAWLEPPPFFPATLLLLNIVGCDVIGFTLGATVSIWLFDAEDRRFYQG